MKIYTRLHLFKRLATFIWDFRVPSWSFIGFSKLNNGFVFNDFATFFPLESLQLTLKCFSIIICTYLAKWAKFYNNCYFQHPGPCNYGRSCLTFDRKLVEWLLDSWSIPKGLSIIDITPRGRVKMFFKTYTTGGTRRWRSSE